MSATTSTLAARLTGHDEHAIDGALLVCLLALACFGLVMVYSVSSLRADELYGDGFFFLKRQAIALLIGLGVMFTAMRIHPATWHRLAYPVLLITVALLVVVLIPGIGTEVGGARRWIRIPGFSIQPGEIVKVAAILYLAHSLSRKEGKMGRFGIGVLPHVIVISLLSVLLLLEPDMGTVMTLGAVMFTMLFVGGARLTHLAGMVLAAVPPVALLIYAEPYRLKRILTFIDPWQSPYGDGFQIIQSFLAFGSGGVSGQGLGDSQQKLFFLPEAHTDFILSVIGEELGLIGVSCVIAAYLFIMLRGIRIALNCTESFSALLAVGVSVLIGIEAFTNAAVVMGLLPTKGLTLPLISYGGSSLVATLWGCGMLLGISAKG